MGLVQSIADRLNRWRSAASIFNPRTPEDNEDPRHVLGRRGEDMAAHYLAKHGYKILRRNFRAPKGGEVDLVCRDAPDNVLAFVEVKTRRSEKFGRPSAAVNNAKQQLIIRGAMAWLRLLDNPDTAFRFDVVEILLLDREEEINLIKGAFTLPGTYVF